MLLRRSVLPAMHRDFSFPLSAEEIEFRAEDTLIKIVPKFRHDAFLFITVRAKS